MCNYVVHCDWLDSRGRDLVGRTSCLEKTARAIITAGCSMPCIGATSVNVVGEIKGELIPKKTFVRTAVHGKTVCKLVLRVVASRRIELSVLYARPRPRQLRDLMRREGVPVTVSEQFAYENLWCLRPERLRVYMCIVGCLLVVSRPEAKYSGPMPNSHSLS